MDLQITLLGLIRDHPLPLSELYDLYCHDILPYIQFPNIVADLLDMDLIMLSQDGEYATITQKGRKFMDCNGDLSRIEAVKGGYYNEYGQWVDKKKLEEPEPESIVIPEPAFNSYPVSNYLIRMIFIHLGIVIISALSIYVAEEKKSSCTVIISPPANGFNLDSLRAK